MLMLSNFFLREKQKLPSGDWNIWILCAGRGFGKTLAGSMAVNSLVMNNNYKNVAIIGATLFDVRNIMIEGHSGLLNINSEIKYFINNKKLLWKNGAIGNGFGGEHYNKLRGYQFDLVWIDEFAKINNIKFLWDQINFCLRLGKSKIIITTTPRNIDILKEIIQYPKTVITYGSSYENKQFLSYNFFENIQKYENTPFGQQEIHGKLITGTSLWSKNDIKHMEQNEISWEKYLYNMEVYNTDYNSSFNNLSFDKNSYNNKNNFQLLIDNYLLNISICKNKKYVIGVDPGFGGNSETGIVLSAINEKKTYEVIDDFSGNYKPEEWIYLVKAISKHFNGIISIETNHGNDLITSIFVNYPVVPQKTYINKYSRSLPIYLLYNNKNVLHRTNFNFLENSMINFETSKKDRIDALVWSLDYLRKNYSYDFFYDIFH